MHYDKKGNGICICLYLAESILHLRHKTYKKFQVLIIEIGKYTHTVERLENQNILLLVKIRLSSPSN